MTASNTMRVRADFNGLFGDLLCLSHQDTCKDKDGNLVILQTGMALTAFDEDADEYGNRDDLIASGIVEPSPQWLRCNGSRWALRIDSNGVRHESELQRSTGLNLLIPDKSDLERDAVANSFKRGGGTVHRIGRFWDPPTLEPSTVRVYGADAFCLVLQQKLGLTLCSPIDELLLQVPAEFLKRRVTGHTLGEVLSGTFPWFIKPVTPKQFRAAVYESREALAAECRDLPPGTAVFVSEPVAFAAEARTFVLDGLVLDAAVYEGKSDAVGAGRFVGGLTLSMPLPRTVVVDVGFIDGRGWAVIEFNAAWGAGLNGCDPDKVLPAILVASEPFSDSPAKN
jgi:ATP-grasp domain-containing protein